MVEEIFAMSGKPKTVDSKAIGTNLASCASHSSVWLVTFMTAAKPFGAAKLGLTLPKYHKNFDSNSGRNIMVIHKTKTNE